MNLIQAYSSLVEEDHFIRSSTWFEGFYVFSERLMSMAHWFYRLNLSVLEEQSETHHKIRFLFPGEDSNREVFCFYQNLNHPAEKINPLEERNILQKAKCAYLFGEYYDLVCSLSDKISKRSYLKSRFIDNFFNVRDLYSLTKKEFIEIESSVNGFNRGSFINSGALSAILEKVDLKKPFRYQSPRKLYTDEVKTFLDLFSTGTKDFQQEAFLDNLRTFSALYMYVFDYWWYYSNAYLSGNPTAITPDKKDKSTLIFLEVLSEVRKNLLHIQKSLHGHSFETSNEKQDLLHNGIVLETSKSLFGQPIGRKSDRVF